MPGAELAARVREKLTHEENDLLLQIDPRKLPRHLAIIMDGNGRWAREHGFLSRIRGHEAGIDSVRTVVRACGELHLGALTLYAFSVENWQRRKKEIGALMRLLEKFLYGEIGELNGNNVRLAVSGRIGDLPGSVQKAIDHTMAATSGNTGLVLNLALSYGGRTEIVDAVRKLCAQAAAGELKPDDICEKTISGSLYHPELGDPDLLIRTSGEQRISNFLLWQMAYTEMFIDQVLWPEFRRTHLYTALLDYGRRERRFGKVSGR